MKNKMSAKIAAGALAGISVLGVAGVAGAATTSSTPHHATQVGHQSRRGELVTRVHSIATSGALPTNFSCTKAATLQSKISTAETKIDARLSTAQGREQAAAAAGQSAKANLIANRIAKATQFKADLVTVSALITAKCG